MHNSNSRSKTIKKKLNKCKNIFFAYSNLQFTYGNILDSSSEVIEIKCNVKLVECDLGDNYTTDFVCTKLDGSLMVVECIEKDKLLKPLTCKMLDTSRNYWLSKGVEDWRLVVGEESNH